MLAWLARNWRKIALIAVGAAAALAGERTLYKTTGLDKIAPVIINSIPCTPGEVSPGCPPPSQPAP